MTKFKVIELRPSEIIADEAAFQTRVGVDQGQVAKLANDMKESGYCTKHPLVVYQVAGRYLMIDGFHRRAAALLAGITKIPCEIFEGTEVEALQYGLALNMDHGKQLDYPADFKKAAKQLHDRGLLATEITLTLWPRIKQKQCLTGRSWHPKYSTVWGWFVSADTSTARKRDSITTSLAQSLIRKRAKEAGIRYDDLQTPEAMEEILARSPKSERDAARQAGLAEGIANADVSFNPDRVAKSATWTARTDAPTAGHGTPVLFLSDIHAGEVVNLAEMGGRNEFNWRIMERRFDTVFQTTVELMFRHLSSPSYTGIVVVLGGDMVTGDIHEELTQTNDKPLLECTFDLSALLVGHFRKLADHFGNVYLVGVPGNHGRMTKKPQAKGYVATNADYHTYRQIQRMLQDDERFTFNFPLCPDVSFSVEGRRFLLTHGDQFKGGDGMIGPVGPIMRGRYKKAARSGSMGPGQDDVFDTMMCGHVHTNIMLPSLIVNGSLKGYDEYAAKGNFTFEYPSQTLFMVHPRHGITWYIPVHAAPYYRSEAEVAEDVAMAALDGAAKRAHMFSSLNHGRRR
jgi:hypothetical protein